MSAPWELILHHSYSGTPGVAFDHSPRHASHGRCLDVGPDDFTLDGQSDGSGAVQFRRRGRISVNPTANWNPLNAISVEVVFRSETGTTGHLANATGSFFVGYFVGREVNLRVKTDWASPGAHLGELSFTVQFADFGIDPKSWIRAGFVYDGIGTAQVYLNGELAKTWTDRPLQPVRPVTELTIGNERGGSLPFEGLIDDIKIWRPNPNRITRDFLVRILDGGVRDCWVTWGKEFRAARNALAAYDVECPDILVQLVNRVQASIGSVVVHSAATRQAWEQAVAEYQRLWARGEVAAIRPVLTRLLDTLRAEGVPLDQVAAIRDLIDSRCFQQLVQRVPPLDCDPQFVQMLTGEGH